MEFNIACLVPDLFVGVLLLTFLLLKSVLYEMLVVDRDIIFIVT